MKRTLYTLAIIGFTLVIFLGGCIFSTDTSVNRTGWAIGQNEENTAYIFHTSDSGKTWAVQGDPERWPGLGGNDISAVDDNTAWAALGDDATEDASGAIIQTMDSGNTWQVQELPEGAYGSVKQIKALSPQEAWAVTLEGTVLHTTDGGSDWAVVSTGDVDIKQVNRMDVKDDDIWIADVGSGVNGIIHSADGGVTWRKETLTDPAPDLDGPMAITIVDSETAWAAVRPEANLYRTENGGATWTMDAPQVSGTNDIDDICAPDKDTVWAVQNIGGFSGGLTIKVHTVNSTVVRHFSDKNNNYQYEGVTCYDEKTVWVVGFKSVTASADLPNGIIRHTSDGKTWKTQKVPRDDVDLWKISFVGAHR